MNDYSGKSLIEFLEYAENKGLMNKRTAQSKRNSISSVFEILDEEEMMDVRDLDIDAVLSRFAHLEGQKFTPASLTSYKSRLSSSIREFVRYRSNPLSYNPSRKPKSRLKKSKPQNLNTSTTVREAPVSKSSNNSHGQQEFLSQHIFPIPLRSNCVVKIAGLPHDLTPAEAKKIAAVVTALAME